MYNVHYTDYSTIYTLLFDNVIMYVCAGTVCVKAHHPRHLSFANYAISSFRTVILFLPLQYVDCIEFFTNTSAVLPKHKCTNM